MQQMPQLQLAFTPMHTPPASPAATPLLRLPAPAAAATPQLGFPQQQGGRTPAATPGVPPGAAPLNPLLYPRAPTPWAAPRQPQGTPLPSFRSARLASRAGLTLQQISCCPIAHLGPP